MRVRERERDGVCESKRERGPQTQRHRVQGSGYRVPGFGCKVYQHSLRRCWFPTAEGPPPAVRFEVWGLGCGFGGGGFFETALFYAPDRNPPRLPGSSEGIVLRKKEGERERERERRARMGGRG